MKIFEKLKAFQSSPNQTRPLVLTFLGDSVTEGCFELFINQSGNIDTVRDYDAVYHAELKRMLNRLFPYSVINIINAGISGNTAVLGLSRLERDVLSCHPDLTVVCFGLNDCMSGNDGLNSYVESLKEIFIRLKNSGSEIIFMTPNTMCSRVHQSLDEPYLSIAKTVSSKETANSLIAYLNSARKLCAELSIPVCDCNKIWMQLDDNGVDTTVLLSNLLNHPARDMHKIFANELLKTMLTK